ARSPRLCGLGRTRPRLAEFDGLHQRCLGQAVSERDHAASYVRAKARTQTCGATRTHLKTPSGSFEMSVLPEKTVEHSSHKALPGFFRFALASRKCGQSLQQGFRNVPHARHDLTPVPG